MAENTEIQRRIHDERGVRSGNGRRHNENVGRFASRSHGAFVGIARAHQNGMDAQIRRDRVCHALVYARQFPLEKCVRHLSAYRVVNSVTQSPQRRLPGENRASKRGAAWAAPPPSEAGKNVQKAKIRKIQGRQVNYAGK